MSRMPRIVRCHPIIRLIRDSDSVGNCSWQILTTPCLPFWSLMTITTSRNDRLRPEKSRFATVEAENGEVVRHLPSGKAVVNVRSPPTNAGAITPPGNAGAHEVASRCSTALARSGFYQHSYLTCESPRSNHPGATRHPLYV